MAHLARSPAATLPPEIIAHILKLALEDHRKAGTVQVPHRLNREMAHLARSPAATLPPEIIAHILKLALEDHRKAGTLVGLDEEREAVLAFTSVCRSWAAEGLRHPRFIVRTAKEASALASKLDRHERDWAQAESGGAPTGDGPMVRARELVLLYPQDEYELDEGGEARSCIL